MNDEKTEEFVLFDAFEPEPKGGTEMISDWLLDRIDEALNDSPSADPAPTRGVFITTHGRRLLRTRLMTERAKALTQRDRARLLTERIKWDLWRLWRTEQWDSPEDVLDMVQENVLDAWRTTIDSWTEEADEHARRWG